ncbi:MAG: hypothetical protein IIZ28_05805 [Erysipelotrichaceae bacterium]|nr:hypothetical protein [Erysipelotrichaceae bacterium]
MRKKNSFSLIKFLLFVLIAFLLINFLMNFFAPAPASDPVANNTPAPVQEPEQSNTVDNNEGKHGYEGITNTLSTTYSSNWQLTSNIGKLDSAVASGVRAKRTKILGNQKDTVTIMVYMCGSDLESQAAMGVYDLQEMASSRIADNVNLIVYTGGTTRWHTDIISNRVNQIYQVVGNGQIGCLVDNAGTGSMVDPNTLVSFIEFCEQNFEANRYELILWDHGGGSVSGYGYDEKYPKRGSMSLAQLDNALTQAGVSFDFIGFDACLMATTETALMLSEHADYMIASEESEPGIGWYYTNWLSKLSQNTSMPTIEIGKNIADDFVSMCASKTPNQTATLSVTDLAEIEDIVPAVLSEFSKSTSQLIDQDYRSVAIARKGSREFAQQNAIDMVDLVDLASKLDTEEGKHLCQSLMSAIKYNNTSRGISNAYGLSIFFPYRSTKYVGTILNTYKAIDMNEDYSELVRNFATYQSSGQVASGGSHNAYSSYGSSDYSGYYQTMSSEELIMDVLNLFMNGSYSSQPSYDSYYGSALDLLFGGRSLDNVAEYISQNHFDADLNWKDGKITLSEDQWKMVDALKMNLFIDDGKGYIDMGKDSLYDIDENGSLLAPQDMTWMVISADGSNWIHVPYYDLYSVDDTVYYGRIPVLINDKYANLMTRIDDDTAEIIGISYDYKADSDIVAKNVGFEDKEAVTLNIDGKEETLDLSDLSAGDVIVPVADYYDYDGKLVDGFALNNKLTVADKIYLGDKELGSDYKTVISYEFTDIYGQKYYSSAVQ